MRLTLTSIFLVSTVSGVAACGDDAPAPGARSAQVTVLVVDQGIDPNLPAFAGKMVAGYTIACGVQQPTPDGGSAFPDPFAPRPLDAGTESDTTTSDAGGDGGLEAGVVTQDGGTSMATADDLKAAVLREFAIPDESCQLVAGIDAVASPFARLESQRAAWNRRVWEDVDVTTDPLLAMINDETGAGAFHGSSTAGIIAHENPAVRLVLVNRRFATFEEIASSLGCPDQGDIDLATSLLSDAEVRGAYASRPRPQGERALLQATIDHQVNLVNESFGALSRYGIEQLLESEGCFKPIDLRGYFAALNDLIAAEEAYLPKPRALVVRAAGNEGAHLRERGDSFDCRGDRPLLSLVGSYGVTGKKSSFTNFGPCVDVFAPGEAVAGPVAGDWWLPQFGTSFAAPLVVRLLSTIMANEPFDPAEARRRLHALRRPDNSIPRPHFPEELLYLPGRPSPLALKTAGDESGAPSPPITQQHLHQVTWPLRWLKRHTRLTAVREK